MTILFAALLGTCAVLFATPMGKKAAAVQNRIAGVSLRFTGIYIWSYRVAGVAFLAFAMWQIIQRG